MTPSVVTRIPPENVLNAPLPNCSGLATRIPARIVTHKPKRMRVSEKISDTLTSMLATKAVADTAKAKIKMPSERTPTGLFGIKPHNFLCSMNGTSISTLHNFSLSPFLAFYPTEARASSNYRHSGL